MNMIPEEAVRRSYLEQAQLSQTHRWIAACLTTPSEEQVSALFADDATLVVNDVTSELKTNGPPQLSDINIETLSPSVDRCVNRVVCDCAFGSSKFERYAMDLHFTNTDADFPLISSVVVKRDKAKISLESEQKALMRSRILSLKHRWHGLVENPTKRAEPFREIVTEDFTMDWGKGALSGFDELAEWVQSTASIAASRHDIADFDCSASGAEEYTARFEFAWSGISLKGEPMQAESEHHWLIRDDPAARYPRIARMEVNLRVPFHIVKT